MEKIAFVTETTSGSVHVPRVAVAVLAAGHGTRMRSDTPKHLHAVAGVPIVERVIRAGLEVQPDDTVVVVSPAMADLPQRLSMGGQFQVTVQESPQGTAAAVQQALSVIDDDRCDWLVSLLGDSPLLTGDVVQRLLKEAVESDALVSILTCVLPSGSSYGRIARDEHGRAVKIVEARNDLPEYRAGPTEINSGIMVLNAQWARRALGRLERDHETQEFLLTDLVDLALNDHRGQGWPVITVVEDPSVAQGVNDRRQLAEADEVLRARVRDRHTANGVTIVGRETVFIDDDVEVGPDTVIMPFTVLTGRTKIGAHCSVGPHAVLHNAVLEDSVTVQSSTISGSAVGRHSEVGPYAHLRGGTSIGEHVHVGSYAEMKAVQVGNESKVGHFSYLGDATLGQRVNIGAGTVTANYDGKHKHATTIGDDVFVGSDSVLVAPATIERDARTGAGSVVTKPVAAGSLVVGVPARPVLREPGLASSDDQAQPLSAAESDGSADTRYKE